MSATGTAAAAATVAADPDPTTFTDPVSAAQRAAFDEQGFVVLEQLVSPDFAAALCERLDEILLGHFDVPGGEPDKMPKLSRDTRVKPGKARPLGRARAPSKRTLQLINVWKADSLFRSFVLSPTLGRRVAELAGWSCGARVANDQVWAKPPGASALTFHRDSAYFDFEPPHVATVWLALDHMTEEVGPLQYVGGSHRWEDRRHGGTAEFFAGKRDHTWNVRSAWLAQQEQQQQQKQEQEQEQEQEQQARQGQQAAGAAPPPPPPPAAAAVPMPPVTPVLVAAGGAGIHNGRLWHGSDQNSSATRPRRGLGIHFVPASARFREPQGHTLAHKSRALPPPAAGVPTGGGGAEGQGCPEARGAAAAAGGEQQDGCTLSPALFPITYSANT